MIKITKLNKSAEYPQSCQCDPDQHEPDCSEAPWNSQEFEKMFKSVVPTPEPELKMFYEPKQDNTPIKYRRIWP